MKNPFIRFWNWLFPYRKYPSTLAEELAIKTPYTVTELQPMIDQIKEYNGFDKNSKEAEQTHIIKEKSYKCAIQSMELMLDPELTAIIYFDK